MTPLMAFEVLGKRALVSRSTAKTLGNALEALMPSSDDLITIDFVDIQAVSPSFVDEILASYVRLADDPNYTGQSLRLINMPTRLSLKFKSIGTSHAFSTAEKENVWEFTST